MIAQYSLLKISFNELLGDELSVGIFIDTGSQVWFDYSKDHVLKAKKFLPEGSESIETLLKTIKESVKEISSREYNPISNALNKGFSPSLNYLTKTYNNQFVITAPNPVKLDSSENKVFIKFFNSIFKNATETAKPIESKDQLIIETKLIKAVKDVVHTNVVINKKIFPGIYGSTKLECLGQNGSIIAVKHLDFCQTETTIDKNFTHYMMLIDFFNKTKDKDKSNCKAIILAPEPDVNTNEHDIWEFILKDDRFDLKDPEESAEVAEFILESNAKKFLT
ncbi:MAG: hypothetical protein ABJC12_02460 [Saprospiraceae bacterium]